MREDVVSILGLRDLSSALSGRDLVFFIEKEREWYLPPPSSISSDTKQDRADAMQILELGRNCLSIPAYLAVLHNVLVSPRGLVFTHDGRLVYESCFPWCLENLHNQFCLDIDGTCETRLEKRQRDRETEHVHCAFHAREGGEVGYFHFINSIVPKLEIYRRCSVPKGTELLVSSRKPFAAEALQAANLNASPLSKSWLSVDTLFCPSPFTFQGNHFARPPIGADLIRSFFLDVFGCEQNPQGRVFLRRRDAAARRIENENELEEIALAHGFESVEASDMSLIEQVRLFSSTACLASAHGAGLSNMVFMAPGSVVIEILSPYRLWVTYRTLAARFGHEYHAVLGTAAGDARKESEANGDFVCPPDLFEMTLNRLFRTGGPASNMKIRLGS